MVKIIAFLGLEPRLNIKYGFNWAGKIEHFSKVSIPDHRYKRISCRNVQTTTLLLRDNS